MRVSTVAILPRGNDFYEGVYVSFNGFYLVLEVYFYKEEAKDLTAVTVRFDDVVEFSVQRDAAIDWNDDLKPDRIFKVDGEDRYLVLLFEGAATLLLGVGCRSFSVLPPRTTGSLPVAPPEWQYPFGV